MSKRTYCFAVFIIFLLIACGTKDEKIIRMATTTSTYNSGLLGYLLPKFKEKTGITVQTIAVGTGKALKHGEKGDVDVVMVHAKEAEEEFVEKGYGIDRREFMYNDFIIVGPVRDPASIRNSSDAVAALKKISEKEADFISRGDQSGTHMREISLWLAAGIAPEGSWYISAGQGMGAVLMMAREKGAYTITDRGTYIAYLEKTNLKVLCEEDKQLHNVYGIILVNPARHKHVFTDPAKLFIDWITSKEGKALIESFKVRGKQLFYPIYE
jgi:tungstate transport system substrate-binding protein